MHKSVPLSNTASKIEKFLDDWLLFSFSNKLKFSIKVSLSLMLAYMIPIAMGWSQPNTAAMTVMLIATTGVVGESVMKGSIRVIGTVVGAIIGITLIALFPQERMTYLLIISILVPLILYLYNAYQGDGTVFMLTAMMILMVFDGGQVDDVFLYGVDRTYMTIFGIVIYTFVGLFLWPVKESNTTIQDATTLTQLQHQLFSKISRQTLQSEDEGVLTQLSETQEKLQTSHLKASSASLEMALHPKVWNTLTYTYRQLNLLLNLLYSDVQDKAPLDHACYIKTYQQITEEIETLFQACEKSWHDKNMIIIPEPRRLEYQDEETQKLSHLQKSTLVTHAEIIKKIHHALCILADQLNQIHAQEAKIQEKQTIPTAPRFIWLDPEYLRGIVQTFLIFWFGVSMWIYFNPPGGFLVVTLATLLSLLTSFSPLKPSTLTILFSVGFLFALVMYIFVLPNLLYAWQLALFIFGYTFIAFYLINPKVSIFFLLGMFTLNITNEMHYHFDIFLITLLVFYLFLAILMLFYYLPFSTKPEHLFLRMTKRLYREIGYLLDTQSQKSWFDTQRYTYNLLHMQRTANKLTLWASQVDVRLFAPNTKAELMAFAATSNLLATKVAYLAQHEANIINNPLLSYLKAGHTDQLLSTISLDISLLETQRLTDTFQQSEILMQKVEQMIEEKKRTLDPDAYTNKEIIEFYIDIDLRHSIWNALKKVHHSLSEIDIKALQKNRF